MSHHTPGPWYWRKDGMYDDWEIRAPQAYVNGGVEGTVAYVNGSQERQENTPERQEANARLIAAAPDLLEALRSMVEGTECVCVDGEPEGHCPVCIARETIAKAEGRS